MSADLLFLPDNLSDPWHRVDGAYVQAADKRALAGQALTVILSGQSVRILPHSLPDLRARERLQAARFHAEPLIGSDPEAAHVAIAATRLGVIDRQRFANIMTALSDAGISPIAVYVDHDVLPAATLPDRIILDTATLDHGFPLDGTPPPQMGLAQIASLARLDGAVNFLTGEFLPKRTLPGFEDTSWLKYAAAALAVMGLSFGALHASEARAERLQTEDLRIRASQAYVAATGTASATPARDVARLAAAPTDAPGALDLTAVLYAALKDTPGVSVESLRYSEDRGRLDLRLIYPGFEATGVLEQAVTRAGGQLQAGGIRETGGRFIGDASLSVGAR